MSFCCASGSHACSGWTIVYEPGSVVYHQSSATIGEKFSSKHVQMIAERNRLFLHWINLHDFSWLISHFIWVGIKLFVAFFTFNFVFLRAFFAAFAGIAEVLPLRQKERRLLKRSDRDIETIFKNIAKAEWAFVIRNPQDYYRYLEIKKQLEANSSAVVETEHI